LADDALRARDGDLLLAVELQVDGARGESGCLDDVGH
jgi:hypothetical protein